MNQRTRILYFRLWQDACAAQGWSPKDETMRRQVTSYCMVEIGGPAVDSITKLGHHEITALFALLRHYAEPDSLDKVGEWERCKTNYRDFNRVRQARHKLQEAGHADNGRLNQNRFNGELSQAFPAPLPAPATVRQMCITADARLEAKKAAPRVRHYQLRPAEKFHLQTETGNNPF
jgi:hypothetical protein